VWQDVESERSEQDDAGHFGSSANEEPVETEAGLEVRVDELA
jgi:hypothetical protein